MGHFRIVEMLVSNQGGKSTLRTGSIKRNQLTLKFKPRTKFKMIKSFQLESKAENVMLQTIAKTVETFKVLL